MFGITSLWAMAKTGAPPASITAALYLPEVFRMKRFNGKALTIAAILALVFFSYDGAAWHDREANEVLNQHILNECGSPCVLTIAPGVYRHAANITLNNLTDVTIEAAGVIFEIPKGPLDCSAISWIRLVDFKHLTIRNITIRDLGSDSSACREETHGFTTTRGSHVTFENVTIENVGDEGIQIGKDTKFARVINSTFIGCARETRPRAASVVVAGASYVRITGNEFRDNLTDEEWDAGKNVAAHGVRVEASDRHDTTVRAVIVNDNFFYRISTGISVAVTNDVDGFQANGNIFTDVFLPIFMQGFNGAVITNAETTHNLVLHTLGDASKGRERPSGRLLPRADCVVYVENGRLTFEGECRIMDSDDDDDDQYYYGGSITHTGSTDTISGDCWLAIDGTIICDDTNAPAGR